MLRLTRARTPVTFDKRGKTIHVMCGKRGKTCNVWQARENMLCVASAGKLVTFDKRGKTCYVWRAREYLAYWSQVSK